MKLIEEATKTSYFYNQDLNFPIWKLIYKLKCQSTENELSDYLENNKIEKNHPIAIISKEQIAGFGQYGRFWMSPRGGIWLSASYPIFSKEFAPDIFLLSVSYHLCEILLKESIQVSLKWPNDIFYDDKKLAGILAKVVTRGKQVIYARIGIGMNINNRTPSNGINLAEIIDSKIVSEHYWTAKILKAIHLAIESNQERNFIIKGVNKFLDKRYLPDPKNYLGWSIQKIDLHGNLIISKGKQQKTIKP